MSSAWAPTFSMFKRLFYWRTWFDILFFSNKYLILIHWPIATISLRPRSPHRAEEFISDCLLVCRGKRRKMENSRMFKTCLNKIYFNAEVRTPNHLTSIRWGRLSWRTSLAMESAELAYGNVAIRRKTTFSFFPTSIRSSLAVACFPLRHFRSKSAGNQKTPAEREEKCKAC